MKSDRVVPSVRVRNIDLRDVDVGHALGYIAQVADLIGMLRGSVEAVGVVVAIGNLDRAYQAWPSAAERTP